MMERKRTPRTVLVLSALAAVGLAACDQPQALGDPNAVIVGTPTPQWEEIRGDVEEALEPRAFTVRDERIFRVTHVDPEGEFWGDTRRFRNVILIGEPGDPWVAEALNRADTQPTSYPARVEARNVWARGQRVIALVLPPGGSAAAARPLLPELGESMLADFQAHVRARMFASGADSARADSLFQAEGFHLVTPTVYRMSQPDPNTFLFINDQPDPAQLQRVIMVSRRPAGEVPLTSAGVLAWREEAAQRFYDPPQLTDADRTARAPTGEDGAAVRVQGVWQSPPGAWPAAGPFLSRAQQCPDGNVYLIDGWVYAPRAEKYEYVLQIDTLLGSFRCGRQPAG